MLEAQIRTKIEAATGLDVYPVVAPDGASAPFVIYSRSSTMRDITLDGPSGIANPVFRIDVYDYSYDVAKSHSDSIRLALNGWKDRENGVLYCNLINDFDLSDITTDPKLHRHHLEFNITVRE